MKKRIAALCLTFLLAALPLAACGGGVQTPSADPDTSGQNAGATVCRQIDTLRLAFVPSSNPQKIRAATEPLKEMLRAELSDAGYDVGTIDITVGASYEAVGDGLSDGTFDVGVGMPGGTYVRYDEACNVILTATRAGLSKDSDNARDWNDEMPTVPIDGQTVFYRSLLIAGPSETGSALGAKVNAGKELTWEDLNAATWSVMDTSSSAGYIYPALWLQEHYGKSVSSLAHTVHADSYADAFARLASGEVDVLLAYADARRDYADRWETSFGRSASIWEETNVIGVTSGIYNDTITVSRSSPVLNADLIAALQDAFINIAATEAGQEAILVYNHEGYQKAVSADYDNERAAQELMRKAD